MRGSWSGACLEDFRGLPDECLRVVWDPTTGVLLGQRVATIEVVMGWPSSLLLLLLRGLDGVVEESPPSRGCFCTCRGGVVVVVVGLLVWGQIERWVVGWL